MVSSPLPSHISAGDVVISRWTASDAQEMTDLVTDNLEYLLPWMAWAATEPLSHSRRLELFERWDRYWATGEGAVYSIRAGDNLVGGCALHRQADGKTVEIGYWLGQHAAGHGIATRTAKALHDAAIARQDITCVQISHDRSNRSSAGVPRRLGFTRLPHTAEAKVTTWRSTGLLQPTS